MLPKARMGGTLHLKELLQQDALVQAGLKHGCWCAKAARRLVSAAPRMPLLHSQIFVNLMGYSDATLRPFWNPSLPSKGPVVKCCVQRLDVASGFLLQPFEYCIAIRWLGKQF